MAGFIFAIFGAIIGMLPHNSIAQLDFEDLLSVSPAAEEKAAPADSAVKSAEEKEEAADETASDEIPPEIDDVEEGGDDGEVAVDDKEIEETAEDKNRTCRRKLPKKSPQTWQKTILWRNTSMK